jgi:hypothetical protein
MCWNRDRTCIMLNYSNILNLEEKQNSMEVLFLHKVNEKKGEIDKSSFLEILGEK